MTGRLLLDNDHFGPAAREAYMAAYHAAWAFIVFRTDKRPKAHSGARSEFSRPVRDDGKPWAEFTWFLGRGYEFKTQADYFSGSRRIGRMPKARSTPRPG